MEQFCDNTSVGVVIHNAANEVLLLNRARFPYGLAAPAGHIDQHGSAELAAIAEVYEEVGLTLLPNNLKKVIDTRRINNRCRRENGDHHLWTVYEACNVTGELAPSIEETHGAAWFSLPELRKLAEHTRRSQDQSHRVGAQVLELVWLDFFTELQVV